jgi:hypothetical protein
VHGHDRWRQTLVLDLRVSDASMPVLGVSDSRIGRKAASSNGLGLRIDDAGGSARRVDPVPYE